MEAYPVFLASNKLEEHLIWPLLCPVTRNSEDLQGFLTPQFRGESWNLGGQKIPKPLQL